MDFNDAKLGTYNLMSVPKVAIQIQKISQVNKFGP